MIKYRGGECSPGDLSCARSLEDYLKLMVDVSKEIYRVLRPGGYAAILIGDTRMHKHYVPISHRVLDVFLDAGFILKEEVIKVQHRMKTTRDVWGKLRNKDFLLIYYEKLFSYSENQNQERPAQSKIQRQVEVGQSRFKKVATTDTQGPYLRLRIMTPYQTPETYVTDFFDNVKDELKRKGVIKSGEDVYKQMKIRGIQLVADYGIENIVIEAEAPCNRRRGKDQLEEYMNKFNYNIGILVDIPTERYYREYPKPCRDNVGFEIYARLGSSIQQVYVGEFKLTSGKEQEIIELAHNELVTIIGLLSKLSLTTEVAKVRPTPEHILGKTSGIVEKHSKTIRELLKDGDRVKTYYRLWVRTMELIYGKNVLDSINDLEDLFTRLTIYVTVLKSLGATILEAALGGGRYTIPIRLYLEGHKAAVELFWYRKALSRFNVNYLFERDEHDWVFDPQVAHKLDQFFKDIGEFLLSIDWSHGVELDLLKRVYQNIVPRDVRRQLGEYYTPDWIVQLILWRALHILTRGSPPTTPLKDQK
ncbi:DNA methyltransferase [Acidilobus sp.]|uniref:DNA methyltransferase n=1 Tax=Acidilobus sp. TaxID=1872109 RepID=UPI003D022B5D